MNMFDKVLKRLKNGNLNFVNNNLTNPNQSAQKRSKLLDAQAPYAAILACSDSRVVPELIFDAGLGDLFVVRVAGNVANSASIASMEYAVAHLNVNLIVVLGHQNCGAVTAAAQGTGDSQHLSHLLSFINSAISETGSGRIDEISRSNTQITADILSKDSQIIADAVNIGSLKILSAFYSLETGRVDFIE